MLPGRSEQWFKFLTTNPRDLFYTLPDEVGVGDIGVASDVQPASVCRHFVSGAEPAYPWMDFFNFVYTHPLGGVDVPFDGS